MSNCLPEEGKNYLIDTNVWIDYLMQSNNKRQKDYSDFIEGIINLATNDKCINKPAICVCNTLTSELHNIFLKMSAIHFGFQSNFKNFRQTNHYSDSRESFKNDYFEANKGHLIQLAEEISLKELLDEIPEKMDFADFLYVKLAKIKGLTIITHDGDFFVKGVEIITSNRNLFNKARDENIKFLMNKGNKA